MNEEVLILEPASHTMNLISTEVLWYSSSLTSSASDQLAA